MATLKQRLHRKNSSGTYDVVHFETEWNCITGKPSTFTPSSHTHSANQISGVLSVANGGTGVSNIKDLKKLLGLHLVGASYNLTNVSVGKDVTFNYDTWKCVHIDVDTIYLCHVVLDEMTFGSDSTYATSNIFNSCKTYETKIASDSLELCISTTVNGATSKVFVPSKEQCEGRVQLVCIA